MIDKLGYLVALARERSFRRAAEACGVAQPTLSAGIKQLETELGVLLVQRSSRYHGLTPEGEKALEWARRLVGDARAMRQELSDLRTGLVGHLRIAVIPTALAMVPSLTTPCHRRHPGVSFTILSCASSEVLEMLDGLEVDAGISYLGNEPLGRVRTVPLYTERYRLVTAPNAPLADRDTVTWAELGALSLCLLTPDMQNRRIMDRLMHGAGVDAEATLESNSLIALLAHVQTGDWASVLPESVASTLGTAAGLRSIAIVDPAASYQVGLILPHREPVPLLTAALLTEARRFSQKRDEIG
jgi:DNA-binding transcriptional LysR family regulator